MLEKVIGVIGLSIYGIMVVLMIIDQVKARKETSRAEAYVAAVVTQYLVSESCRQGVCQASAQETSGFSGGNLRR